MTSHRWQANGDEPTVAAGDDATGGATADIDRRAPGRAGQRPSSVRVPTRLGPRRAARRRVGRRGRDHRRRLRFTTAVSAAIDAGCSVVPARWADDSAITLVADHRAVLAGRREDGGPSLSPTDLVMLDRGVRLVLPSPNGAELSVVTTRSTAGRPSSPAACVTPRDRAACGTAARTGPIAVIACGERWGEEGLRPAVEDLLGAAAILGLRSGVGRTRLRRRRAHVLGTRRQPSCRRVGGRGLHRGSSTRTRGESW